MENKMTNRSALIVIDMENGFLNPESLLCIPSARATVPPCTVAINFCRSKKVPVFFVNRVYRADGSDVEHPRYDAWLKSGKALSPGCPKAVSSDAPDEFCIGDGDYLIIKPRFSAFFGTELDLILRRLKVDTVLLAGTTTPNCIRSTCYDAISLEYNVAVLSDCCSSVTDEIQQSNMRDMANIGAQILTCEDFIGGAALRDSAGAVSRLVAGEK